MYHIRFYFLDQLLQYHSFSRALYFNSIFRIQQNIHPDCTISRILIYLCSCHWIEWIKICIQQMLDIVLIFYS